MPSKFIFTGIHFKLQILIMFSLRLIFEASEAEATSIDLVCLIYATNKPNKANARMFVIPISAVIRGYTW